MKIAVIGAGNVGGALAEAWVRAGHNVIIGTRDGGKGASPVAGAKTASTAEAITSAEVVVIAVPWDAVPSIMKEGKDWSGKFVIDCTNPIGAGMTLALGHTTSAGEYVASLAPDAHVIKAFNTIGYKMMKDPKINGSPVTMLYATDAETAKSIAEKLINDVGFIPVFAGPLKQARYMEPFAMLWISMVQSHGLEFAFSVIDKK